MLRVRTVCMVAVALGAIGFFVGRMLVAQDRSDSGRRGFRFGSNAGMGKIDLLKNSDVQKDLKLSDSQKTTLEKFSDDMHGEIRKQLEGFRNLPQDERRSKMAEIRAKLEDNEKVIDKKLDEVLSSEQRQRLSQIELQAELQSRPLSALEKKEVADNLELTDDQKQKLTDLREAARNGRGGRGGGGPGGPGGRGFGGFNSDARKKMVADEMAKIKEILTPEQSQKLEKMQGKKFEGDLSQIGFGGFGGFGGRGGRRGRGGPNGPSNNNTPPKSTDKPADKSDSSSAAAPTK